MRSTLIRFGLMISMAFAVACGGSDDEDEEEELPDVDCSQPVPAFVDVSAFDVCTDCHSSALTGDERQLAPVGMDFDTLEGAADEAEEIAEEVHEGKMPPAPYTLTEAQKQELYRWALCGNPR
jgi:uncharacterized membrane protein